MKLNEIILTTIRKTRYTWAFNLISILILALFISPVAYQLISGSNIVNAQKATSGSIFNEKAILLFTTVPENEVGGGEKYNEAKNELIYKTHSTTLQVLKNEGVVNSLDIKNIGFNTNISSKPDSYDYNLSLTLLPKDAFKEGVFKSLSPDPKTLNVLAEGMDAVSKTKTIPEIKNYLSSLVGKEYSVQYSTFKSIEDTGENKYSNLNIHFSGLGGRFGLLQENIDQYILSNLQSGEKARANQEPVKTTGKVLIFDSAESKNKFIKNNKVLNLEQESETDNINRNAGGGISAVIFDFVRSAGITDPDTAMSIVNYFEYAIYSFQFIALIFVAVFFIYDFRKNVDLYGYLKTIGAKRFDLIKLILAKNLFLSFTSLSLAYLLSFGLLLYMIQFQNFYYSNLAASISNFSNLDKLSAFNLNYIFLGGQFLQYLLLMLVLSIFPILYLQTLRFKK